MVGLRMAKRPKGGRYSVHPGIARMGGSEREAAAYLRAAPGYVDAMYGGARAGLRKIHDALEELAFSLGKDIRICPGKTIVPVYAKKDRITHRMAVTTLADIDEELREWLRRAYALDGD